MYPSVALGYRHQRAHPVRRRAALPCAAALALALPLAAAGPATALCAPPQPAPPRLTLPAPTGHHLIGTTTLHLVDASHPDPWVPTDPAELMVQLWYPASTVAGYPRAPWMTAATARSFEKENNLPVLNWPITHAHLAAPVEPHQGGWPVVLYAPGAGDDRETNTAAFEDLASHGYVVAAIDFVHDAGQVELPDGQVATSAFPPVTPANEQALSIKEVDSHAVETSFVLDQLTALDGADNPDHEHQPLPQGLHGALDLGSVGMFGHSNGGSTTAHLMHVDPRIKAGADLDGTFWTPQAVAGSDRPMLMFGAQDLAPAEASSWAAFRANQRGPNLQLSLTGSMHRTFTDLAVLVPQVAPLVGLSSDEVTALVGTINGQRAITIQRAYLGAFFDTYLRHHESHLLTGPSPRFPEVQFVS